MQSCASFATIYMLGLDRQDRSDTYNVYIKEIRDNTFNCGGRTIPVLFVWFIKIISNTYKKRHSFNKTYRRRLFGYDHIAKTNTGVLSG